MVVVNGWTLLVHPLCLDQIERLITAVERTRAKDPMEWRQTANAKLLAALRHLMFERIPADPALPEYRQGDTQGPDRKHWFRAKFGSGRFRLFFRYSSSAKIIIYAWVNDQETLRTYGSRRDAYKVFRAMLDQGNPPEDWAALLRAAMTEEATFRPHGRGGFRRRRWMMSLQPATEIGKYFCYAPPLRFSPGYAGVRRDRRSGPVLRPDFLVGRPARG